MFGGKCKGSRGADALHRPQKRRGFCKPLRLGAKVFGQLNTRFTFQSAIYVSRQELVVLFPTPVAPDPENQPNPLFNCLPRFI